MTAAELVEQVRKAGGQFRLENGRVAVKATPQILTPAGLEMLRDRKEEVAGVVKDLNVEEYLRLLHKDEVLDAPHLPPQPPALTADGYRRSEVWSAWWDAIAEQRRRASHPQPK